MKTKTLEPPGAVHIVTAFLVRGGELLVLRRSEKVGTYRGKWAGVSGYLQTGERPLERALREMEEETGIAKQQVALRGEGPPMPVAGTPFVVHPFLFEVKEGDVQIDWEHTESRWIDPLELSGLDAVPRLAEAFESAQNSKTKSLTIR